ncbi:4-hydroxy-tetrahydrodipicolinate synthase [Clostridium algidicarnis]|uniref:4-hydroxy-tetrahydrodipicolinate synthase n=2 Tax=Clostridium algidicarnis TaxID=37659 RepID=A0A2S6FXT4_9CLOT|nr:4-hydroxy-tetrahydrodipicolinate synthase [Clostridium algidicarnis]MBB6630225.1 4-hydroxy-tetrahydrodipicolinate synthase [Clostridium algidicarnis]MBU3203441.1 4-hydroxy-tetrahydrodipicolinate synthase [Clostridium algidicarnis]MBU3211595.1 4-hydroxy-tetrahydrodipicolinate synthase [Clostridium algidicarnis]MBU3220064.1 4-hydroxy-tetrahydrodipicolinate synthase [Clostridium algidicarnis]MBU3221897.1 4-hydroxy-tetrahydrodipicolinate synthase [Clostridium algidicarnis]
MALFKGSGVAIVTPFNEKGVDFDKLKELLEWHVDSNTDAIIICGTTGEASTMSTLEKKEVIKFTVDTINKRIPVIAGTGTNDTKASMEMSKWAESIGVDGLLVITPYYNKTNNKGLIAHFTAISNAVNTPIILYNVPSRTGMNISPTTLLELAKLKNVVAVKEASGDISQVAKYKALCKDKIDIYSGNDDQIIPILSLGGIGVISVLANIIPKDVHDMCHLYLDGKVDEALDVQLKSLDLTNSLFIETNPIPVKTALNLMGLNVGDLRLPLCSMDDNNLKTLENEMHKYGLLK